MPNYAGDGGKPKKTGSTVVRAPQKTTTTPSKVPPKAPSKPSGATPSKTGNVGYDSFSGAGYYPQFPDQKSTDQFEYYFHENQPGYFKFVDGGYGYGGSGQTAPGATSSGGGGGGGGRSGSGSSGKTAALNAIKTLYQQYQGSGIDQAHLDLLNQFTDKAGATGNAAIDRLSSYLNAQGPSAYQTINLGPAVQASNPMQAYMEASGLGGNAMQATQDYLQSVNDTTSINASNLMNNMGIIDQNAAQGRLDDVAYSRAGFEQQLANEKLVQQQRLADEAKARKDEYMKLILQYAIDKGINLKKAGITF